MVDERRRSGRRIHNNRIDRVWIYGPLDATQNEKLVDWTDNVDEKGKAVEF